jgi:hypothetical protein
MDRDWIVRGLLPLAAAPGCGQAVHMTSRHASITPRRRLCGLGLGLLLSACAGDGGTDRAAATEASAPSADVAVLMLGNSHTVGAGLPARLQTALQGALPGRSVRVVVAPDSAFLDEHLVLPRTSALLAAGPWQAVVLQAQKYSSSGQFAYSTAEAEELVRRVRARGALPVLFPEWARRGVDESDRIWALHSGIAQRAPACVAPVPQAWQAAQAAVSPLPLHASDDNHAAAAGAQLTALVLMAAITGQSPTALDDLPDAGATSLQRPLREAAAAAQVLLQTQASCPR